MASTTLDKVKRARRISHNHLDEEIRDDIAACIADLRACGILAPNEEDPLVLKAVKLYCLGHLADDPAKSAEYLNLYNQHKGFLQSAKGYGRTDEATGEISDG